MIKLVHEYIWLVHWGLDETINIRLKHYNREAFMISDYFNGETGWAGSEPLKQKRLNVKTFAFMLKRKDAMINEPIKELL